MRLHFDFNPTAWFSPRSGVVQQPDSPCTGAVPGAKEHGRHFDGHVSRNADLHYCRYFGIGSGSQCQGTGFGFGPKMIGFGSGRGPNMAMLLSKKIDIAMDSAAGQVLFAKARQSKQTSSHNTQALVRKALFWQRHHAAGRHCKNIRHLGAPPSGSTLTITATFSGSF